MVYDALMRQLGLQRISDMLSLLHGQIFVELSSNPVFHSVFKYSNASKVFIFIVFF